MKKLRKTSFINFSLSLTFTLLLTIPFTACTSTSRSPEKKATKAPQTQTHITAEEDVVSRLSDPDATINAKLLYNYIRDMYGKKVITGQMENAWDDSYNQLQQVYDKTEKYPALMGFDFMNYSSLG